VIIKGINKTRAMEISKIQDMFGEYYIWEMPKMLQDKEMLAKMNYIGGEGVMIDDTKVWSNSKKVRSKLRETLVMRDIRRNIRGKSEMNSDSSWGSILAEAMTEQLEIREIGEISYVQKEDKYNLGILVVHRDNCLGGVYYLDCFGQFWDEITHRKLNNEEMIKARLTELAQVYKHQ
jgi:hypothetical protein